MAFADLRKLRQGDPAKPLSEDRGAHPRPARASRRRAVRKPALAWLWPELHRKIPVVRKIAVTLQEACDNVEPYRPDLRPGKTEAIGVSVAVDAAASGVRWSTRPH